MVCLVRFKSKQICLLLNYKVSKYVYFLNTAQTAPCAYSIVYSIFGGGGTQRMCIANTTSFG